MVFTSYWGNLKNLDQSRVVSISRSAPFWHGDKEVALMPEWKLVQALKSGRITEKGYTYYFKWYLWTLDPYEIYKRLDGKILCCYEKHGFCHRHIVAEWFNHFGLPCRELERGEQV